MTKKDSNRLEEMIFQRLDQRLDKMEVKIDKLTEEVIPQLKLEAAVISDRSGRFAIIITLVGGALALLTSAGVAMWLK